MVSNSGKMDGPKQVRVDNWGTFFLQRLGLFFNKTDYCDLTLQFEGNVQLKVHRLVMNACTDYFQVLEQNNEVTDDVLIMPPDLQADVVLPIVNFMYTGMLEFNMSSLTRLYKTAQTMNIPVLTKLLDAQNTPPTRTKRSQQGKKSFRNEELPSTLPGRKIPVWKRKSAPTSATYPQQQYTPEPKKSNHHEILAQFDNTPKPTRFEWPDEEVSSTLNLIDSAFDISYTSKPLLTQEEEPRPSTSFDQIRQTPSNLKKFNPDSFTSTSIDFEEIKEYIKEQKIRNSLVRFDEEDADDLPYDGSKRKSDRMETGSKRFRGNEKENKLTKIHIDPSKGADVDHTKIISEVLKKYPHLMKKNKNIKLKILAKNSVGSVTESARSEKFAVKQVEPPNEEGPWRCTKCSNDTETVEFILYYLYRKHMTDVHNEKFDSRMCRFCGHRSFKQDLLVFHEHTKHGVKPPASYNFPKCNRCPYVALNESQLARHKANHTGLEMQCVKCKLAFNNQPALTAHLRITGHNGKTDKDSFDCQYCTKKFQQGVRLFTHVKSQHRDEARRDGIISIDYTDDEEDEENETLEPKNDKETEYILPESATKRDKIRILSNVKVPNMDQNQLEQQYPKEHIVLEPSSEAEALSNVASGIATSLGLVDVVVLDENQQYILQTNNHEIAESHEQQDYLLPGLQNSQDFAANPQVITSQANVITQSMLTNSDIASTDELVMVLTDQDYGDGNTEIINSENSNIVVLYSHPVEGHENQFITSEGNLMINSQNLIEVRNSNQGTPMETFQSEPTMESIEMIEREINSHTNNVKQDFSNHATDPVDTKMENSQPAIENNEENKDVSNDQEHSQEEQLETTETVNENYVENHVEQPVEGSVEINSEEVMAEGNHDESENVSNEQGAADIPTDEQAPTEFNNAPENMAEEVQTGMESETIQEQYDNTDSAKTENGQQGNESNQDQGDEELKEDQVEGTEENCRATSQSAKNILEDWDDTDSQQSDHKVRANATVHKLIDDDWADEDDEENRKK